MKKILYSLLFIFTVVFTACEEDLPKASFGLYELKSLTATAGDMNVTLSWEAYENARPNEYLILWTSGSSEAEGGEMTVDAKTMTATINNLVNDVAYTFSVQPRYAGGLASKTTAACTPKNARYPISDLTAAAGNERVRLRWTKPASERFTRYQVTVNPGNQIINLDDTSLEEYIVDGLTNDQEYTFNVVCVYPTGNSIAVETSATPGLIYPILASTELVVWEPSTFAYNDMYFMTGEVKSVSWDFGDGTTSGENNPVHAFATTGTYTVAVTVTYVNNTTESGSLTVTVGNYKWNSVDLNFGGLTGYVKTSNPVFSPDGKTMYIPTSTPAGHLFAIDVVSGEFKWVFAISQITYGGGALVAPDGTIYQCVRNAAINNVYAINPNGTQKWAVKLDAAIGAFPALSVDGILYCLTNKSTLYALDASSGAIKWQQSLDGATGSAVAIDKAGNVYAGTSAAIYAFKPNKDQIWKLEEVNVTEQATFALKEQVLYATLKGGGLVAVDMTNGTKKWTYPTTKGDAYFPIADKNGNVYFTEKGSQTVHAVNAAGSKIWEKNVGNNLNYSGGALSTDGILYVGTQSNNKVLGLDITNGNIVFEETVGQQVMAAVTIGPDKRLYCGTIGSNNIGSVKAFAVNKTLATDSWSIRGGDIQGTNRQK
ncbi:PQQ-binding-like beta-propeller repeat protein [Bacteroides sp. BFG-638]|uniref:PQQ-binding-like beta-propeller repeat protein n=2 Tax=Bacteroides TaxID=816 RepID=A0ABU5HSK5_9BACE|nr:MULTISPECIES: PQQ-binding-like beta-propeller repeat protein [unclassified Bacteroides]MCS2949679.1 PQQ-binding-like beta-propeller repeat protein [Bacteroides sp. BFG-638]MCS3313257.1 PQQ-binding-like beta-propeller repeat protein [Bacteroides sp. BFG-637]MDY7254769.1 PQQ-binding-like beta-propeller repeat protein [Bacteroides sp. A1-P5]MDY7259167.1 PQQ-binding-like beta-propeller repeat protein [Bacteroides sp. A2-P53]